jgi:predicted Zn-dependent protease
MIRSLFAAVVLAWLSVGCAPADRVSLPATLSVSPAFPPEEMEAIVSAADAWTAATGNVARLDMSVGDGGTIVISPGKLDHGLGFTFFADEEGRAAITIDTEAYTQYLADTPTYLPRALMREVVMHELGHAFGLDHEPGGLMAPVATGIDVIDDKTLRHFCDYYGCPL